MLMCGYEMLVGGWVMLGVGCLYGEEGQMAFKEFDNGEVQLRCIPPEELKNVTPVEYPPCPDLRPPELIIPHPSDPNSAS